MRARGPIWLLAISLALVGMPASAFADRGHHPAPDPRPLWRVYPLGAQPTAGSTGTGPVAQGIKKHSEPIARSADGDGLAIGLPQLLALTALLCILAAMVPSTVRRAWSRPPRVAARVAPAAELTEPLRSARRELIDARPAGPTRSTPTRDEAIVRYAAAYAAASQRGDRAPMAAVRAAVPKTTQDPAAYAKRMIAEARRRGLLTSHGRGKAQGELTPKALDVMRRALR